MTIIAKLINSSQPDAEPVVVRFPITQYEGIYSVLNDTGMGDPVERDCHVVEIGGDFEVLKALQGQNVNIDELDYLAKRLGSFMEPECLQFECMAAAKEINNIEDFINLTFCSQQATVIADFSDLCTVGRNHYLNKKGGCAPLSELDALDAKKEAQELIQNGKGVITPYGVVYDNGMELERLYRGREFPAYIYEQSVLEVEVSSKSVPDAESTWLYLPMPEICVERALRRGGFKDTDDTCLKYDVICASSDIFRWIDQAEETLDDLNKTAKAIAGLNNTDLTKLCAVAEFTEPADTAALRQVVARLDMFAFYPDVSTTEDYGRYMITKSGNYTYDEELHAFYDFEQYGEWRMSNEQGAFLDNGYVCYNGTLPLEEMLSQEEVSPDIDMKMGGM